MNDLRPWTDDDAAEKRSDVRVVVKVKNALILRKMEEAGIESLRQLAERTGLSYTSLCTCINMKRSGRRQARDNDWRKVATKLSEFFRCLPEDLFSDAQQYHGLKTNTASRDVSMEDIKTLLVEHDAAQDPEQLLLHDEGLKVLNGLLLSLTPREHRVVTQLFGLDQKGERTLDQCAQRYGLSRERIRQIESKALRKLKHKSRSGKLRPYVRDIAGYEPDDEDYVRPRTHMPPVKEFVPPKPKSKLVHSHDWHLVFALHSGDALQACFGCGKFRVGGGEPFRCSKEDIDALLSMRGGGP